MKILLIISIFIFSLVFTEISFAESSASVNIENSVSSNNEDVDSHTKIKVETNGNVTEYESDEPNQKIEVNAVNDKSEIKIDDQIISESASQEGKKDFTPTPSLTTESDEDDGSNIIVSFFKKIFSFLDFL